MRNLPPLLNKDKNECPRTLPEEWLVETLSPGGRPPPQRSGSGPRAVGGHSAARLQLDAGHDGRLAKPDSRLGLSWWQSSGEQSL